MSSHPTAWLAYGKGRIPLELDPRLAAWHVIEPRHTAPIAEPDVAFREACGAPIGAPPLRAMVKPHDRVVIVTSDGTRPVPNKLLIRWILDEIGGAPERVSLLVGTGTHRANTPDELRAMLGEETLRRIRVIQHNAYDEAEHECVGRTSCGAPVCLDKAYVQADKRIVVGFIEPHFFAGFSGGPKGVAPGVASLQTILHLHRYALIADPGSTWGILDGNPLHETIREMVSLCPPEFMVNVALNREKAITAIFAGAVTEAHRAGCAWVHERAMAAAPGRFPVVVTSNSGYPLDQNLYQTVKGMSAAARIVEEGGAIAVASECSDGIPAHGRFASILRDHADIEGVDAWLRSRSAPELDQWQAQVLAQVRRRSRVALYSSLAQEEARACHVEAMAEFQAGVESLVREAGAGVPVAVLPEGPVTIPYVA